MTVALGGLFGGSLTAGLALTAGSPSWAVAVLAAIGVLYGMACGAMFAAWRRTEQR